MKYYIKFVFGIGILSVILFSCKESELADGGPCSYSTLTSPATVIKVDRIDSVTTDIQFRVENENGFDTISYRTYFSRFATDADVKKYDLKVGNVFTYEIHEIKKGTCNPYYYTLRLEKYK
ncbi:hypothetical protein BH09BAC5_BH09BAC5_16810 [soil metagenome]